MRFFSRVDGYRNWENPGSGKTVLWVWTVSGKGTDDLGNQTEEEATIGTAKFPREKCENIARNHAVLYDEGEPELGSNGLGRYFVEWDKMTIYVIVQEERK